MKCGCGEPLKNTGQKHDGKTIYLCSRCGIIKGTNKVMDDVINKDYETIKQQLCIVRPEFNGGQAPLSVVIKDVANAILDAAENMRNKINQLEWDLDLAKFDGSIKFLDVADVKSITAMADFMRLNFRAEEQAIVINILTAPKSYETAICNVKES